MATTKKKKPLASHLTDFEKLAGTILLVVYLAVLPFFAGPLIDWFCGLLGFSVSRAASNVICFYLLFAAAVLIFHSFLYQTSQTLFKALEHCCKTLGLSLVFFYGLNEIVYRLSHLLWGNPTNLNDAALLTQLTAAPRMMAIVVISWRRFWRSCCCAAWCSAGCGSTAGPWPMWSPACCSPCCMCGSTLSCTRISPISC